MVYRGRCLGFLKVVVIYTYIYIYIYSKRYTRTYIHVFHIQAGNPVTSSSRALLNLLAGAARPPHVGGLQRDGL